MGLAPFDCQHTHGENGAERANKARTPPTFKQLFPNEDHNYLRTPSEHLGVMRINLNVIVFELMESTIECGRDVRLCWADENEGQYLIFHFLFNPLLAGYMCHHCLIAPCFGC